MVESNSVYIDRDELVGRMIVAKLVQAQASEAKVIHEKNEPVKGVYLTEGEINHLLWRLKSS